MVRPEGLLQDHKHAFVQLLGSALLFARRLYAVVGKCVFWTLVNDFVFIVYSLNLIHEQENINCSFKTYTSIQDHLVLI